MRRLARLFAFDPVGRWPSPGRPRRTGARIPLDSLPGRRLLEESASPGFVPLAEAYVGQRFGGFCGIASCAMVLRALDLGGLETLPLPRRALFRGMTLGEVARLLVDHGGVRVAVREAREGGRESFREALREAGRRADCYLVVNYTRRALGVDGGGHVSPVGAYHETSDRVLIVDTSGRRHPPAWVRLADLWAGLCTPDEDSGEARGYLVIEPARARGRSAAS